MDQGKCGFEQWYGDGSGVAGVLVESEVSIGDIETVAEFGGVLRNYYFEGTNRDGLLGLAYKSMGCKPTCVEPIFDNLVRNNKVGRDQFSICIDDEDGGTLTLGGTNPNQYTGDFSYTPLVGEESYYTVQVESVDESGKIITRKKFNAIVDSGTTLLALSDDVFKTFKTHFTEEYCHLPKLCGENADDSWFSSDEEVALSDADMLKLPNISFVLKNNITLTLTPYDYMLQVISSRYVLPEDITIRRLGVSSFTPLEELGIGAILGDTFMKKYYTLFDRENKQIGFAQKTSCTGSSPVEDLSRMQKQNYRFISKSSRTDDKNMPKASSYFFAVFLLALAAFLVRRGSRSQYEAIE